MGLRHHRPRRAPPEPGAIAVLRVFVAARPALELAYARARWLQKSAEERGGEFLEFGFSEEVRRGQMGVMVRAKVYFRADLSSESPLASARAFLTDLRAREGMEILEITFGDWKSESALRIFAHSEQGEDS